MEKKKVTYGRIRTKDLQRGHFLFEKELADVCSNVLNEISRYRDDDVLEDPYQFSLYYYLRRSFVHLERDNDKYEAEIYPEERHRDLLRMVSGPDQVPNSRSLKRCDLYVEIKNRNETLLEIGIEVKVARTGLKLEDLMKDFARVASFPSGGYVFVFTRKLADYSYLQKEVKKSLDDIPIHSLVGSDSDEAVRIKRIDVCRLFTLDRKKRGKDGVFVWRVKPQRTSIK